MPAQLYDTDARDAHYGAAAAAADAPAMNVAQYLLDLDNAGTPESSFNFCGGMMFGLVMSDALRNYLADVAAAGPEDERQPVIYAKDARRMAFISGYAQDASADNRTVFHGREVRRVPNAAGGMGFVIHLSLADGADEEGWTAQEIEEYSGWLSDQQRRWRDGPLLESEGFGTFRQKFGPEAFTLHHRFYLHLDAGGAMWLAAEDGCEGTPQPRMPPARDFPNNATNVLSSFFGR